MEAIILAGGLGTRLRPVVPDLPKPMASINGRPFLEHQIDYWLDQGVRRFILSVGYKHEHIEQYFGVNYRGAAIAYTVEKTPLGTGGGLLLAMSELRFSGPWLVLNGDTFFDIDLVCLKNFHSAKGADITLSLFQVADNTRYTGIEIDGEQRIIASACESSGRQLVNGGVYLFGETALAGLPFRAGDAASLENDILRKAMVSKRLYGYVADGKFIDIGVPEDYTRAGQLLP